MTSLSKYETFRASAHSVQCILSAIQPATNSGCSFTLTILPSNRTHHSLLLQISPVLSRKMKNRRKKSRTMETNHFLAAFLQSSIVVTFVPRARPVRDGFLLQNEMENFHTTETNVNRETTNGGSIPLLLALQLHPIPVPPTLIFLSFPLRQRLRNGLLRPV
jgi:hypothetical protein